MSFTQRSMGPGLPGLIHDHWGLFLTEGIILTILGLAAMLLPPLAGLATAIILGWLFLLAGIVGFRLAITRLEGKWKLGQNRTREDRDGVVRGLDAGDEREQTIARLMREAVPQTTA